MLEAGHRHSKAVGIFATSVEQACHFREQGVSFIALHSDTGWLAKGAVATDMPAFSEFARQHINGFPGVKDVYTAFVVNEVKAVNMMAGLS